MLRRDLPYVNRGDDLLSLQHQAKSIADRGKSKYGEDGGSKSRREQWDNEKYEEKVADVKRKQPRCDLTRTRPEPYVQGASSALRIAPWKRTMAGICKSVITVVFVRRI